MFTIVAMVTIVVYTSVCDIISCRTAERKSATECVRCLRAFTNGKYGLKLVLNHESALTILARAIDVRDEVTMLETVRLMAGVCLVPPHGYVLDLILSKL